MSEAFATTPIALSAIARVGVAFERSSTHTLTTPGLVDEKNRIRNNTRTIRYSSHVTKRAAKLVIIAVLMAVEDAITPEVTVVVYFLGSPFILRAQTGCPGNAGFS